MIFRLAQETLNIDSEAFEIFKESENIQVQTNIGTWLGGNARYTTALALGLIFSSMKLKTQAYLNTRSVNRTHYSLNRLGINNNLNYNAIEEATRRGYNSVNDLLHYMITGSTISNSKPIALYIITATSGITNISKLMKNNNIPEIQLPLQQSAKHALRIYKIENKVYIITNNECDMKTLLRRIAGAIPLLYNDLYKDLNSICPQLYDFFAECFYESGAWTSAIRHIKAMQELKDLKNFVRKKRIEKVFDKLEHNLKNNAQNRVTNIKNEIKRTEDTLNQYYKQLQTAMLFESTAEIPDVELIMPFLINNKDVTNIKIFNNKLYLKIIGEVDYDKKEIKKVIKHQSDYINWLFTHPKIHLHWESNCVLDIVDCTVNNTDLYEYSFIPNTHWKHYDCFGDNRHIIQKALNEKDYLTVFSKTITAAYQLNVYDMTVLNRLLVDISNYYTELKTFYHEELDKFMSYEELKTIYKEELTNAQ